MFPCAKEIARRSSVSARLLQAMATPRLEKPASGGTMLSQLKPPFRAEHIGSLLRPKALLEQRAKFARGEIGADALTAAEDAAIKDAHRAAAARRPEVRDRRRIPPPLLPQLLLSSAWRSQHRHRRRRGCQRRRPRQARQPAGRADQKPRALDAIRSTCRTSSSSPPTPRSFRRSPSPAPARCTFAAATPRCWRPPTRTSTSSGTTPWRRSATNCRRWPMPAAAMCRSTRPRSPSSAIPRCRRN